MFYALSLCLCVQEPILISVQLQLCPVTPVTLCQLIVKSIFETDLVGCGFITAANQYLLLTPIKNVVKANLFLTTILVIPHDPTYQDK
jgi:hypothetical protein